MQTDSPRAEFRARLRSFMDDHPEMERQVLAKTFVASLAEEDRPFITNYLTVDAESAIAELIRVTWSQTRNGIFASLDIANPDTTPDPAKREDKLQSVYERISEWREFVPGAGLRRVLDLTRPQLLAAAGEREKRLHAEVWRIELDRRLAARLPNDTDSLSEHMTDKDIVELGQQIRKEILRGNLRIAIKPVRPISRPIAPPRQTDGRDSPRPEAH